MFYRHHADKLIYPIVVLIIFLVLSYRPKYHLNSKMPEAFFPGRSADSLRVADSDKRLAWAYWESAQMDVQWKYSRNSSLPPEPPAEFRVDMKALGPATADPQVRVLYWHRLQNVWNSPDTWSTDYQWDFGWVRDPVNGVEEWVHGLSQRFSIPGH
jgi:hypothetical protein